VNTPIDLANHMICWGRNETKNSSWTIDVQMVHRESWDCCRF